MRCGCSNISRGNAPTAALTLIGHMAGLCGAVTTPCENLIASMYGTYPDGGVPMTAEPTGRDLDRTGITWTGSSGAYEYEAE